LITEKRSVRTFIFPGPNTYRAPYDMLLVPPFLRSC